MALKSDFFERLRKAGRLPVPTTEAYFQEIEDINELKETIKELKEEVNQLKAADTSISVYENKFKEMDAKDLKKDLLLKQKSDVLEEQKVALKYIEQKIEDKDQLNTKMKAEIGKLSQEN